MRAATTEAKGMLGDWGHAQCSDNPPHHHTIRKPTELPRTPFNHHRLIPEYSDSDDEAWMNWGPKASEEPAVQTSQHIRKPTPDDLYAAFNPWYREAPKKLLDRTVSRQPLTQRYWSLTACEPGCCSIHRT